MKKLRKSLAVLLAIIMLASFTPLFASAEAITINRNNVKIVPPSVSPSVIEYGQTLADVTLTGGECWYVDPDTGAETLVPGHFEVRSTTTKPAVSDAYTIMLKFVSDDTTQYSNITLLTATLSTIKSGTWPTLKVIGLDGTLIEAPTAADILTGQPLSAATLTGGVVNDADGNAVTGTWSYVYPNSYPTASGKYEVQFKATGYNALKTTIDVTVTSNGTATLETAPIVKYVATGKYLSNAVFEGGKVVDGDGAEITTGTWMFVNDDTQKPTEILLDKEGTFTYKAQWVALGYPAVFTDIQVTVAENGGYTVDKPTLPTRVPFVTGLTHGTLPFVYGNATVPGTYTIANPDTALGYSNKTHTAKVTFTPDNTALSSTTWSYSFKVIENTVWYTAPEEPVKIIVPYGHSSPQASKSSAVVWPEHLEESGVLYFSWTKSVFDASTLDVGEMQLVSGLMTKSVWGYGNVAAEAYIQVEPAVHSGDMGTMTVTVINQMTAECAVRFYFDIPGATGTVTIKQGDKVLATFTPDENGKIDELTYFKPAASGTYTFTAEYTPGLMDKVTIENPVITSGEHKLTIQREMKYYVYDATERDRDFTGICGKTARVKFMDSGYKAEELEYWEVLDQNGNAVTLYDENGNKVSLTSPEFSFVLPDDASITELHFYPHGPWDDEIIIGGNDDTGTTLVKLWQKLTNWLVELYRTIVELLIPTVETF